jgi:hypothetical protein
MLHTIQVEIDESGQVHPLAPSEKVPVGRALLIVLEADTNEAALLSEPALAAEWLSPEEDEAWAHLQPHK